MVQQVGTIVVNGASSEIQPYLEPFGSGDIVVVVKTLAVGNFKINLSKNAIVGELKERIWSVTNLEPRKFHVGFSGKILWDEDKRLVDFGVGHESEVHMFVKRVTSEGDKPKNEPIFDIPTYRDVVAQGEGVCGGHTQVLEINRATPNRKRMFINARVNGMEIDKILLDTGANYNVMSLDMARACGMI